MGDLIRPDFKLRKMKAKLLKQQERRDNFLYKARPYIDLFVVMLVVAGVIIIIETAFGK